MKILLLICLLGSAVFGQEKADLIPADAKFTPDQKNSFYTWPDGRVSATAAGTLNGVAYSFFFSGSGSIEGAPGNGLEYKGRDAKKNWHVSCKKDLIDDSKTCYMDIYDLTIFVSSKLGTFVSVGGQTVPGSSVVIRIDDRPAITSSSKGPFVGQQASEIVTGLKTAKRVVTRYEKWPSGVNVDKAFELYGFNEALAYLNWAVSKIK